MSAVAPLLPPLSTDPYEYATAAGMSDDLPVPFGQIMDPYQTPAAFLPWLAAHHSVDLWFDNWTTARKREIIAQYAGVSTTYPGESLPELKGTHEGALRYLTFVDAEVIDLRSYPARFVMGLSSASFTPIAQPPFRALWLVKVLLEKPFNGLVMGRSALGSWSVPPLTFGAAAFLTYGEATGAALRDVDIQPILRAKRALDIARAPETEYLVSFAWRRPATFDDPYTEGALPFGGYVDLDHL